MMREKFADKFARFFVYSLMALILVAAMSLSISITYVTLSWAFGWR